MKLIRHFKLLALLSLTFVAVNTQLAKAQKLPAGIKVQLVSANSGPFLVGEPVLLLLSVSNASTSAFSMVYPTFERFAARSVSFLIKPPGATAFQRIESPGIYDGAMKMRSPPKWLNVLTVTAGSNTTFVFQLDFDCPMVEKRRFMFPDPGQYSIKAEVYPLLRPIESGIPVPADSPLGLVETEQLQVDIENPSQERERNALEMMQKLSFDYLLYAPDQFDEQYHVGAIQKITAFCQANEETRYATFTRFFLAYAAWKKAQGDGNISLAREAALRISQETMAPVAVRAMAERLLPAKTQASEPPPPFLAGKPKVMLDAIKELESQWYDVKGFTRRSPEGQKAYIDKLLPLANESAEGKLTQEAYDLSHAELLKECVRKFTKPLSPEEWKTRYDTYAAEEAAAAAQRATQDEALRRRAIELLERKPK